MPFRSPYLRPRRTPAVAAVAVAGLIAVSACASSNSGGSSPGGSGSTPTVNVAVVQALTGPGAQDGQVNLEGSELAAANINAAGGIKSLGGAKINVVSEDAGATTDTAAAAVQLAISKHVSIGMGAELSSQSLAMEPIWTRAKIPWITGSVADSITAQGSQYTFRESAGTTTENQIIPKLLVQALKSASHGHLGRLRRRQHRRADGEHPGHGAELPGGWGESGVQPAVDAAARGRGEPGREDQVR